MSENPSQLNDPDSLISQPTTESSDINGGAEHSGHSLPSDDLVVGILTSDHLPNMELALDQLTTATDLFDVPAIDFDSAS